MKTTLKLGSSILVIILSLLVTSCKGDENKKPIEKKTIEVKYLDATKFDKWVYFSFAKESTVDVQNPEKDQSWDVAFHREQIRVNSKEGFSGNGGVALTNTTSLESELKTSALKFVGNIEAYIPMAMNHNAMTEGKSPYVYEKAYYVTDSPEDFDPEVKKSKRMNTYTTYVINMEKMGSPDMYQTKPELFVFKSANGKDMYKVQFTGAVNDQGKKGGTLSFRYQIL